MKGILLAGGRGSRLYPTTDVISKHLLPVFDKPMIYYSLSLLIMAGVRDVLIITTPQDLYLYRNLLGDGKDLGMSLSYCIQQDANGIAEAFILGKEFIGNDNVMLVLGDNILIDNSLPEILIQSKKHVENNNQAYIFAYKVSNPKLFGVLTLNNNGEIIAIEEKPNNPTSNYAIVGVYFYPNSVVDIAQSIQPSNRGEKEISSINEYYCNKKLLNYKVLENATWFDAGSCDGLLNATNYIANFQKSNNKYIACIEELAYKNSWVDKHKLQNLSYKSDNEYYRYLRKILD
ncbi:MAG: NTP transferase domain-containing protein [Neisseriaceae bacterium]|nr:NTP transferase domain-containing protein [Neisseriaceae bacterium]